MRAERQRGDLPGARSHGTGSQEAHTSDVAVRRIVGLRRRKLHIILASRPQCTVHRHVVDRIGRFSSRVKGVVLGHRSSAWPVDEDFSSLVPVVPAGGSRSFPDAEVSSRPQRVSVRPWVSEGDHVERMLSEKGIPTRYQHIRDQVKKGQGCTRELRARGVYDRRSRSVLQDSRPTSGSASPAQRSHLADDARRHGDCRGHPVSQVSHLSCSSQYLALVTQGTYDVGGGSSGSARAWIIPTGCRTRTLTLGVFIFYY